MLQQAVASSSSLVRPLLYLLYADISLYLTFIISLQSCILYLSVCKTTIAFTAVAGQRTNLERTEKIYDSFHLVQLQHLATLYNGSPFSATSDASASPSRLEDAHVPLDHSSREITNFNRRRRH